MASNFEDVLDFPPPSRQPTLSSGDDARKPEQNLLDLAKCTDFDNTEQEDQFWCEFDRFRGDHPEGSSHFFHYLATNLPPPNMLLDADRPARRFYEKTGYYLLRWLIREMDPETFTALYNGEGILEIALGKKNQYFGACLMRISSLESRTVESEIAKMISLPCAKGQNSLHLTMTHSLACAAEMVARCAPDGADLLLRDENGDTPLHLAMKQEGKKDWKALKLPDGTPSSGTKGVIPRPEEPSDSCDRPPTITAAKKTTSDVPNAKADQATFFEPRQIYHAMKRKAEDMPSDRKKAFMAGLLTRVNNLGRSPYQLRLGTKMDEHKARTSTDPKEANFVEWKFREEMKRDIFEFITDISEVRTALYGTEGQEKELFLDMTDFSRPSLNFQDYITDLTDCLSLSEEELEDEPDAGDPVNGTVGVHTGEGTKEGRHDLPQQQQQPQGDKPVPSRSIQDLKRESAQPTANMKAQLVGPMRNPGPAASYTPSQEGSSRNKDQSSEVDIIGFEDTLFYVCLPDMTLFKETPQTEVRRLFKWLQRGGVRTIRHLSIPDSSTNPLCDLLIHDYITKRFSIEKFEWRKLDINLDILTLKTKKDFQELTLYSSGNWSTLYHWASKSGLLALPKLTKVTVRIVQLHSSTYKKSHSIHASLSQKYKQDFERRLEEQKAQFKCEFEVGCEWNYPVPRIPKSREPYVPNLQLLDQLGPCHRLLQDLRKASDNDPAKDRPLPSRAPRSQGGRQQPGMRQTKMPTAYDAEGAAQKQRLQQLTIPPKLDSPDPRIKVAILDNGADRVRTSIRGQIAKGVSYVTGGPAGRGNGRILPWWMASDPHGTQMASLVAKANPYCRLYIARVGRGRKDILAKHAAEAIDWALGQRVDIISISWVMKTHHELLHDAIKRAVEPKEDNARPTLVFCSTADEGVYSGTVYPASYDGVVNVAATDQYGHMKPASATGVDILVPGENIVADGPSYMEEDSTSSVSGSSVATATAAGIASLALMLLRTFNPTRSDEPGYVNLRRFYTRDGILGVFDKMNDKTNVHVSSGVVPTSLFSDDKKKLAEAWKHTGFKKRVYVPEWSPVGRV